MPLLENASSPLYILHGERLPTQRVEELRFELHEGRQIARFGSPYRDCNAKGSYSSVSESPSGCRSIGVKTP